MNLDSVSVVDFFYLENVQECCGVTSGCISWAFLGDGVGEPSGFYLHTPISQIWWLQPNKTTISRPTLWMEKFYFCIALFPKELSMLYSTSGLQFYCRINQFRKDTLSLEVHNLKEIPALFFAKKSCFRAPCFPLMLFLQLLLSQEINVLERSLGSSPCSSW